MRLHEAVQSSVDDHRNRRHPSPRSTVSTSRLLSYNPTRRTGTARDTYRDICRDAIQFSNMIRSGAQAALSGVRNWVYVRVEIATLHYEPR